MSDFKNAFDSYKKASAGKTGKSGFSDDKHISEKNKKNTSINNSNLPEHLKKSLSENNENGIISSSKNTGNINKTGDSQISIAEKYVRQSIPDNNKGEGSKFLKEIDKLKKQSRFDNSEEQGSRENKVLNTDLKEKTVSPEKYVFHELDKSGRNSGYFIKETEEDKTASDSGLKINEKKKYTDSGLKRVAKLLALLGRDEAANVLKSFSPAEIEKIASELLKIKQIDHNEASELLKIIHKKNSKKEIFTGGVDKAREILIQAYGTEKGEELLKKSLPENREKPFLFLNDIESHQIKMLLNKESSTIAAIILSHLSPEKSASLLEQYTAEEQKELILKMSRKGRISSEIAEKIENGLKDKIREQGKIVTKEIDGKNRLAGILRFMDPEEEERILEELTDEDPDLSREIDSKIFSIDIIHDIPDRDFQKILNDFSETEIAMILKGRSGKIKKKFAKNLSMQRKELIHRESEFIGIVRKSDVNKSTTEFLDYIRQFEKDGKIIINRGGNLFV